MKITARGDRSGGMTAVDSSLPISIGASDKVGVRSRNHFHHMRLFGVLTIFAAILTTLLGRTVAGWMRACFFLDFLP